jgi:leucyl-tRNA synthetase
MLAETVGKVTQDIVNLRFNTAISKMMVCLNTFAKAEQLSKGDGLQFLQLLAPFAPHIAEEIYARIDGELKSISLLPWPEYVEKSNVERVVKIVVQVNGKARGECHVDRDMESDSVVEIVASDSHLGKFLAGKKVIRTVLVPGKIINIVVE